MTRRAVPTEPPERLLDMIYDAATEETLWTQALIQIADMTGSLGGMVVGADLKHGSVPFLFNGRMSEDSHRTYAERHIQNPWGDVMMHSPVGMLVQSDEILPLQNLKRTAFFDEVLRPEQLAHNAMVNLVSNDGLYGVFNLCRSEQQGLFGEDALRLLSQLYPHIRRSLILGFRINGYRALQHAQSQALDRLSAGILLIDRGARVIFANTAARAMTGNDGPLRLHNTILSAVFPPDAEQLEALVAAATRGDSLVRTMSLPHPHDGRLLTVQITSLRSRDLQRLADRGLRNAAAMVVIRDPAQPLDIPVGWIVDTYGLTPAEARVALCAASGATIPETAHRLNVSPNTVKTHLSRVFAKTGTSRQIELARLMESIALLSAHTTAVKNGT